MKGHSDATRSTYRLRMPEMTRGRPPWRPPSSFTGSTPDLPAAFNRVAAFETDAVALAVDGILATVKNIGDALARRRLRKAYEMRAAGCIVAGIDALGRDVEPYARRRRYQPMERSLGVLAWREEMITAAADTHGCDGCVHDHLRIGDDGAAVGDAYLPDDGPGIDRKLVWIAWLNAAFRRTVILVAVGDDRGAIHAAYADRESGVLFLIRGTSADILRERIRVGIEHGGHEQKRTNQYAMM